MTIADVLGGLNFLQLMAVLLTIILPVGGLVVLALKRGIRTKWFSVGGNGNKATTPPKTDIVLLLEVLKIKQNISDIDNIVLQRQKRYARNVIMKTQDKQLRSFGELLKTHGQNGDITTHRDYMYYNLLSERMYRDILSYILDSFEKNGLASKDDYSSYPKERTESTIRYGLNTIYSYYPGIQTISREKHDEMIRGIHDELSELIYDCYQYAIDVAKKGQKRKDSLNTFLYNKIREMDTISEDQLQVLFSDVMAEDFLD